MELGECVVKYRHRLDDMLEKLHASIFFVKIDLKSVYRQIHMKEGDECKTIFKKNMVYMNG